MDYAQPGVAGRMRGMIRIALWFSLVAAVAACSKKTDEGPATPPPPPAASADAAAAVTADATVAVDAAAAAEGSDGSAAQAGSASAVDFDKLSHEDKIKFMKTQVMPPMKAAFQKFDPKAFAKFGCKTCHGKDPQKAKYKMPSPDIPALDFDALHRGEDKEIAEFMAKTVKPQMAKILNVHEMTQLEPTGFGCLDCHTEKKKKG
jgi:hypothetical protein